MTASLRSSRRSAFTLVELLTVIAIIGVLAAILIPTVSRVRTSAKAATCQAGIRQVGSAVLMYASENKGRAPVPNQHTKTVGGHPVTTPHWYVQVAPYLGVTFTEGATITEKMRTKVGLLAGCPLAPRYAGDIDVQGIGVSYGWTNVPIVSGMPALQAGVYLNQIPHPGRTIMISERWGQNAGGRDTNWAVSSPYTRTPLNTDEPVVTHDPGALRVSHGGRAHFLFFDGHVAPLLPSDTYDPADLSTGNLWRGL